MHFRLCIRSLADKNMFYWHFQICKLKKTNDGIGEYLKKIYINRYIYIYIYIYIDQFTSKAYSQFIVQTVS